MTASTAQHYPARTIRTRRMDFAYPDVVRRRHFVQGDLVMSHVVAVLSALFPEGEDFFVRSVRHFADQITDPELKQQVAGFIGQEVTHGREHRELNERLQEMGYPTRRVDRFTRKGLARDEKLYPPEYCLGITAALEHYTATLAEVLLGNPKAREVLGESSVREMLLWHALEESEHKSVAFDVFQEVCGSEKVRVRTMRLVNLTFVLTVVIHTLLSLAQDRAAYNPIRLVRSLAGLRHSPFLSPAVIRRIRSYTRPGFHPDQIGSPELLDQWRAELFGPAGVLEAHQR
ncbi:MAG TPA: metal-dependent hydrolase [Mycobacteriales bacterium]